MSGRQYHIGGKQATAIKRRLRHMQMDALAELVADGMSVKGGGEVIGLAPDAAADVWRRICATLGAQAV